MDEEKEIEPVPMREFHIDDLPEEPKDEWAFLKDEIGEPVFGRGNYWECDVCGGQWSQSSLERQVDYLSDDGRITKLTYYVCPCCKYPGLRHVVLSERMYRDRKRPLVGDPDYEEWLEKRNKRMEEKLEERNK